MSRLRLVQDDDLERPVSEEAGAAETTNGTIQWFQSRMEGMLRRKGESALSFSQEDMLVLFEFVDEQSKRRLFVYFDQRDHVRVGLTLPKGIRKKSVFLLKQRSFNLEGDGSLTGVLMGDVPPDILENLSTVSHEVLYPTLCAGRTKDFETTNKEVTEVFHRFLSQAYLTVGQTQGKTLLPLPPRDAKWEEGTGERSVKDKERVHVLESSVVTWTQQIKNVLRREPPSFIQPGNRETGTAAEFVYWKGRCEDLSFIDEQLKSTRVQQVLRVLEMTKSTYEKPFQKLVAEVEIAREEAQDVHLFLGPLQHLLKSFEDVGLDQLKPMFKPAMHTISLIYAHSKSFCTPPRLQAILEKLGNDVIHTALRFVNGRTILDSDPSVVEDKLHTTIQLFGELKSTYLEYKEASMATERQWLLQDELVFNLPDQFVERCYDMIDLVQMASSFGQLQNVQVGGDIRMARSIDQINSEFHAALRLIESTGYDLLDIAAKKYNDDFFEFRRTVRDCERRLGSMISERMENVVTLGAAFNFLACFEVMLDRKIIMDCLYETEVHLLEQVRLELQSVNDAFVAGQDMPPPFYNMPIHSSRVFWCRSLVDRIKTPMDSAHRMLRNVFETPEAKEVVRQYEVLLEQISSFEKEEIGRFLNGIDTRLAEKLKQPLLVRDQGATKKIKLNFDPGVWSLLREARYFYLLKVDVPEAVEVVYSKAEIYQQHAGNIQLIVNSYNILLSSMADVELPLMLPKLELVDEALEEGLEHLNWRNHSIASFIKKTTSYIADATNLLAMLKSSVRSICEMLRGWGTTSLHGTRKNTVGAEEYHMAYKASVEARLNSFRDEAAQINSLIAQIHMALQVSRGDPAWRKYVEHVNDMIVSTLRTSIIESLESIRAMIDPATRKELSNALVEVRLELVAPEALFFPEISSNLSHSSLEDLVEYWITATLSIAKLLQRIDSGESNYYNEIANSPDVLELVSTIRDVATRAFEMAQSHRNTYLEYSHFWMSQPSEEFGAFLQKIRSLEGDDGNPLNQLGLFDQKIAELKGVEATIKAMHNRETIIWISVDAKPMKQALFTLLSKWTFAYTNHLLKELQEKTSEMSAFVSEANAGLKSFSDEDDDAVPLSVIMGVITEVRKNSSKTEEMFGPWLEAIDLLQRYGVDVPTEVVQAARAGPKIWNVLKKRMYQCRTMLEDTCNREQNRLRKESAEFIVRANAFCEWFKESMPFVMGASPDPDSAYSMIDSQRHVNIFEPSDSRMCLSLKLSELRDLNQQEELYDIKPTVHEGLQRCSDDLVKLKHVWDLVCVVNQSFSRWNEIMWFGVKLDVLIKEMQELEQLVAKSHNQHSGWPVYESMTEKMATSLAAVSLMSLLQSPVLRQRHWKQLLRVTGGSLMNETDIKLHDLFALSLPSHSRDVEELVTSAEKECEIEARLQAIEDKWSQLSLTFTHSDAHKWVLKPQGGMMSILHEALVELQSLSFNTNVAKNSSFSELVRSLQQQLSGAESLLSIWLLAQHKHATLHALFSSAVSRSQCGEHADAFEQVHSSWRHMMTAAAALPSLQDTCTQGDRHKQVKAILIKLEDSQAKLLAFLDDQRSAVPRFYMLSNEALLVLLSLEAHPNECMPYIRQLFPGIQELGIEFKNGGENQAFTSMRGRHGERVSLTTPVMCDGAVQKWVVEVEAGIQEALKNELSGMATTKGARHEMWLVTPALQLAATLVSIEHCAGIEECLLAGADKGRLSSYRGQLEQDAATLARQVRIEDLPDVERNKLSAMITHTGIWRSIVEELCGASAGGGGVDQFDWRVNLRFYMQKDTHHSGGAGHARAPGLKCTIGMCNITKDYGYSYVGDDFAPLMRTSTSQAVQIALITAHHMASGGHIKGPSSSGKLEIVRCTANTIGLPCIVVQAHSSFSHRWLAATVSGVAHMGAWLLMRNFEKFPTSILSHLAQLYSAVLAYVKKERHGKKDATRARSSKHVDKNVDTSNKVLLDGVHISVHTRTLLIASSVWEANAPLRAVPETLALLLRPATTHLFEPLPVITGWLFAKGFGASSSEIAAILVRFFKLCQHSLSPAAHYDWGLRHIKRILAIAQPTLGDGGVRYSSADFNREMPEPSLEDALSVLGRACRLSISSRLLPEDEMTFRALIDGAFFSQKPSSPEPVDAAPEQQAPKLARQGSRAPGKNPLMTSSLVKKRPPLARHTSSFKMYMGQWVPDERADQDSGLRRGVQEEQTANMPRVVSEMGFQPFDTFVARANGLCESLAACQTAFVTGPVGCGKTSLIQVCARQPASARHGMSQAAVVRSISLRMMSVERLFGYIDVGGSMRWVDGVLSTIYRDMAAVGEGEDVPQQWLVLDGCLGGEWLSMVERTLHKDGELMLSSQERIRKTSKMRTIFESDTLTHAAPSLVSHGAITCMRDNDVGWSGFVQSWLSKSTESYSNSFLAKLLGNGDEDIIPCALAFLTLECSFVATVNQQALVETITTLLSATSSLRSGEVEITANPTDSSIFSTAESHSPNVLRTLCFALMWGFGAMLKPESRPKFSAWLRSIGEEHKAGMQGPWAGLPSTGLVWDYFPDHDESGVGCVWKPWSESVPAFRYIWSGSDEPDTIVVPTEGLASAQHVMRTLNRQGRPVLVMGGPGVGKTQVVRDVMAGLDLEVVTRCCVTLSGATDTEALQNALEVPLEGKSGKTQGNNTSGGNAKVCYFIDDLHLPRQDAYGEQAALELIRHVLDRGHWFDRDSCQERTIHKCTFIGAMSPSHVATASRARFIRHFSPIILHDPSPPELQHIYESLTSSLFRSLEADADLLRLAQPLVRCTIKQLTGLSSVLMPSHEKPHYLFSQHDIAKVFHGLFENSELCTSPLQATQLWLFLCKSTFMGRLVSQDDCNMCLRIIMNSIDSLNEHIDMDSISKMHCNFICARDGLNQPAIRIVQPWQDPSDIIKQRIDTSGPTVACTGGAPTEEDLNAWAALCGDVLTKVTTSLHHSGGHVHLAGPGGSGKYTVAKAAAVLCGLQVVELQVTEGEESLRQQLCSVFWDAGVGKVNQALLLPSHIPASSGVLGMISDVLAPSGYAQMIALFTAARQNDIYAAMRGDVRKQGMEDSRENCWVLFNIQAHKHLRVVCTSATNDIAHWGRTAMSYPLLITRMTVVWLGALPPEKTHGFGMPYLQSLLEKELQEERPELVSQVSRHLTLVHQAAADFLARPQPPDPTPPLASYPSVSFTWYAQTWTAIYTRMRDEVREKLRRAVIATDKLDAELTRLSDLEAAIEDQRQVVEQKKLVANRLLANVGQETALLNEQKVILEEDANAERRKAQIVREIERDIRMHMDDMTPFQELAATSLERMEAPVLVDIRGLATPPESVLAVIRCIVVLLIPRGKQMPLPEALAWKEVRKCLLNNTGFIAQLEKFDVKNTSLEAVDVAEGFIKTESFSTPEKDGAVQTPTIEGLKAWVEATVKLFHLQEKLKPMEERLEEKRSEHDSAKAKYNDLQSRVRNLEVRLGDVMSSFQDATEEKNAAIMRLDDLTASCAIARKLAVCLAGGRANRLQQARERFKQKMECLLGDSLTAAAFVSFGGALGANCRESFIRYQVLADLRAQKVQVSSGPVLSLFASHYTAEDWKAMGLPDDQYCLESASIALNSTAWPLLVDPEGIGLRWLTALYQKEGTALTVVPNQSPALLPKIRACVQNGTPIVITGPLAGIDPGIMLVASRRYYTHQRTVVVDVAGEVLEVHPKFRLFFSTGLGRVDFCLELSYIASVVSFTGSEESAWQKALWCVVGHEAPSVRDALLDMHARRRQLLRDKEGLEDSMLKALSEEEGMVLSDGLAARLSEDLGAADTLDKELVDAEDELAAAKEVMRLYEPVARRGAVLMQVATKLIQVSPICAFSTPTLLEAIEEGVERSAQTIDGSILQSLIIPRKKARASEGEGEGEGQGEGEGVGEGGEPNEAEEEAAKVMEEERLKGLDIVRAGAIRCMRGVTERVAEVVGAAMETKDRNVFSAMVAIAVFLDAQPAEKRAEKQEVIDLYLTMPAAKAHASKTGSTSSSPFPSWLPDSSHSAIIHFTKSKRGSPLKNVGSNLRDAKILFDTTEPELLPEEDWPKWGLDALERWVALCALRPDRAVRGAHMFASHVLAGKLPLEPPALTSLIQQGTAATRPLLIVLPHSSDLFDMQESLMQAVGGGFDRAIVDGNNDEHVSAAVDSAMQLGRTILVHSPELSVKWQRTYLDPLLDRLSQAGWDRGQEVEIQEAPRTSPSPPPAKSSSHGGRGSGFPAGSGRVLAPLPNPQAATVSVSDTSPTPGFRLVLCVVASGASLLLSRDTLACCTKVRLEAPTQFDSFFNRSQSCLSKTTRPGKIIGTPKSPSDPASAKHLSPSPSSPNTPTAGGDATSPVSHAVSADDMNWLPKGVSYAGLIHKLSLLHAVTRMRALHGPVGLSATGLSNEGGITYSLRVCAHASPTVGEREAEGQWHSWEQLMMSTWILPEIVWDADMRVMSSIAGQIMGSIGDLDGGMPAVTEGFGSSRLWVSEWSEKNLVVTEGAMLQKEMSLVLVQRHKREISRMDKAKMALDEIQERLPRSMPLPVPPSGEAPDLFFYFLLREVTRMRVLMDSVWSSLVDIEQVLEGQRQLNPEQDDLVHSLYIDCVPTAWASVAYPSLRPLGAWFSDLVVRSDALGEWQRQGVLPPSVWMGGLFSPDGLLSTAVAQHSMQMMWQISQVRVHFDVTRKSADEVALGGQRSGKDGLLVHGFFLEAAGWDVRLGALEELKPSQGPEEMPVISIRVSKSDGQATECPFSVPLTQTPNAYNCPVYRTQARGETFLFSGLLKTRLGEGPWTRAGTAMILDAYMG